MNPGVIMLIGVVAFLATMQLSWMAICWVVYGDPFHVDDYSNDDPGEWYG